MYIIMYAYIIKIVNKSRLCIQDVLVGEFACFSQPAAALIKT